VDDKSYLHLICHYWAEQAVENSASTQVWRASSYVVHSEHLVLGLYCAATPCLAAG
jgi:hypothetical protein